MLLLQIQTLRPTVTKESYYATVGRVIDRIQSSKRYRIGQDETGHHWQDLTSDRQTKQYFDKTWSIFSPLQDQDHQTVIVKVKDVYYGHNFVHRTPLGIAPRIGDNNYMYGCCNASIFCLVDLGEIRIGASTGGNNFTICVASIKLSEMTPCYENNLIVSNLTPLYELKTEILIIAYKNQRYKVIVDAKNMSLAGPKIKFVPVREENSVEIGSRTRVTHSSSLIQATNQQSFLETASIQPSTLVDRLRVLVNKSKQELVAVREIDMERIVLDTLMDMNMKLTTVKCWVYAPNTHLGFNKHVAQLIHETYKDCYFLDIVWNKTDRLKITDNGKI